MDYSALVGEGAEGADEDVAGDGLTEDFDFEDVGDYFFGFLMGEEFGY